MYKSNLACLRFSLLKELFLHSQQVSVSITEIIKPAHYLTEATSAYEALEKFKPSKLIMANGTWVVDPVYPIAALFCSLMLTALEMNRSIQ